MARPRGGARCPLEPRARTGRRRLGIRGRLARLVRGGRSRDRGAARALVVEVRPQGRDGPADVLHPQVSERSDQRDSGLHGQPHLRGVLEASPRRVAQVQAALARARVTHVTLLTLSPIVGSYLRTSTGTKYATSYRPLRSAGTQRTRGALGPGLERGEAERKEVRHDRRELRGDRKDIRHDTKDIREDRREVRQDLKNGDTTAARHEARDLRH